MQTFPALIDDYCYHIDVAVKKFNEKHALRAHDHVPSRAHEVDDLITNMLLVAIKKQLKRSASRRVGVLRMVATVGCTRDYFRRVWFGTGNVNKHNRDSQRWRVVFNGSNTLQRIARILQNDKWHTRHFGTWQGAGTPTAFVDIDQRHPQKSKIVVTCKTVGVLEHTGPGELQNAVHYVISFSFPVNSK